MDKINWIQIVATIFLSIFVTKTADFVIRFYRDRLSSDKYSLWKGEWHVYHYSRKLEKPELIKSKWLIDKTWYQEIKVEYEQLETSMFYYGKVERDSCHVIFRFHDEKRREIMYYRMKDALDSTIECIPGIYLSYDHDKRIVAGGVILSKIELAEDEVKLKMEHYIKKNKSMPLLHIPLS